MNNVLAIVDLYENCDLGLLTRDRPLASTTFLGRYAFIDFALSNLSNSGIDNVCVLAKNHSNSIYKHIGNTNTYLANPKTGYLSILINEEGIINPVFNTDINNIKENDFVLYDDKVKYVVITNSAFIMKMDYKKIVEDHIKSGKQVSLVYKKVEDSTEFSKCKKLVVDNLNCVQKIYEDQKSSRANILLDTMVIDKTLLLELLVKSSQISAMINVESMVGYLVNFVTRVNAIEFTGFVRFFDSLEHYFKYSLELLNNPEVLKEFFQDPEWVYYTTTHNSHPVLYGPNANVTNNIIANNNYLSTEAVLSLIILKHNLVLKNIGVRFNFNLGMHWDGNQLKEDVVIYHFPQKSNKLYRNLSTQMSLPHSIEHLRSLQIKLQYLFDIKFITKDLYDLYENIIKKFNLIENINLPVKLANMINLLDFFRLAMPAVVSFLKKNEEFYLQPLDNDTKIMIFIKNQSNYNRITICPSVRMNCLDNRYCNFEFRISLYEKNPIKDVFLGRDEGIEAIKSFKNIFPYAQVEINDKNIYFRTFFDIFNIEVWLLKFGGFYKKYLINLDYI